MKRKLFWIISALAPALIALPVYAGGWSVLTMDSLPGEIRAGEEVTMGFMIRAHGRTPVDGLTPMLKAFNPETGERLQVQAEPGDGIGHYTVSVTFPSEGQWQWEIGSLAYPQVAQMAPLTVLPAAPVAESAAAPTATTAAATIPQLLRAVALLLLAAAVGLFVLDRRQSASTPAVSPTGD